MSASTLTPLRRARDRSNARSFRSEIQALRALAVLGVLVFHLWPEELPGGFVGVDVFFVLSGFLITDHLVRELASRGRISRPQFWARRARRLLPAAMLVLFFVSVVTLIWVPDTRWTQFGGEIVASAFYVENWALAAQSVDYMALSNVKSPVQHFWSLGVEEQFYLVWPVLLGAIWLFFRRRGGRTMRAVVVALAILTITSLIYSITLTALAPTVAYFSTFTRAWEFGAGATFAAIAARGGLRIPTRLAALTSWSGLGLIVASMTLFSGDTPFPSFTAALPVAGTLLVIASGRPLSGWGPRRLYELRAVQFVGDVSYGTYLWHWPLIILLPFVRGAPNGTIESVAILFASIALGWTSKVLLEDPIRTRSFLARARPRWSFAAVAVTTAAVSIATLPLVTHAIAAPETADRVGACYGASAMVDAACGPADEVPLLADLSSFSADLPPAEFLQCELSTNNGKFQRCDFGEQGARGPHVALLGDSHATRMAEPIRDLVAEQQGRLSTFLLSGCASMTRETTGSAWGFDAEYAETCRSVSQDMIEQIARDASIDVVVMTNRSRLYVSDDAERHPLTSDMVRDTVQEFQDAGKRVIVLRDPPERFAVPPQGGEGAADCPSRSEAPSDCALPRAAAEFADPMREGGTAAGADVVSLDDLLCTDTQCMSRIGGVVVYSDDNHLTRSFALSLLPQLRQRLSL